MRGIKRDGRHRAEGADELAVPGRAERVAAVLEQPEIVLLREGGERVEIARDADGVRDENRARLRADGGLDLRDVDVVDAGLAIDEDGDESVLHQRRERGGKRDRRRDDLVARAQAVLDLRAEQRGDHEQIRRRAGVDQIGRVAAEVIASSPSRTGSRTGPPSARIAGCCRRRAAFPRRRRRGPRRGPWSRPARTASARGRPRGSARRGAGFPRAIAGRRRRSGIHGLQH